MVTKPPNRNLSDQATPWGRWVEDNIQGLQTSDDQQAQGLQNSLKAINGSLAVLSLQQSAISAQQSAISAQQSAISDQQSAISAQAVRASQANTGGYNENGSTFGSTDDLDGGAVILTPPDWATKATVIALTSLTLSATGSRYGTAVGRVYIGYNPPVSAYNGASYLKRSAQLSMTADASVGRTDAPQYPSTGYTGPINSSSLIYVGIGGVVMGSGSGVTTYAGTTTAIAFWS